MPAAVLSIPAQLAAEFYSTVLAQITGLKRSLREELERDTKKMRLELGLQLEQVQEQHAALEVSRRSISLFGWSAQRVDDDNNVHIVCTICSTHFMLGDHNQKRCKFIGVVCHCEEARLFIIVSVDARRRSNFYKESRRI